MCIRDSTKEGQTKTVDAKPRYNILLDIGKAEAMLNSKGQVQGERYTHGQRLLTYVVDINNTPKGCLLYTSRCV